MVKQFKETLHLLWSALFLDVSSYDEAAEGDNTFVEGLFVIVLIGIGVAIAQIVGAVLGWATMPDLSQLKDIFHEGLVSMSWFQQSVAGDAQSLNQFEQMYDLGWRIARLLAPNPRLSLAGLVLTPLQLMVQWLWFALAAQATARLLGGRGEMKQTLGATSIAFAPQLVRMFSFLPGVGIAGVGAWTLLTQYVAIRRVHENLSWGRVLIAVIVPRLLLWLVLLVLLAVLAPLLVGLIGGMVS